MDRMVRVSIIMGVYNCEKTVGRCIESMQKQTFQDWEFIICDDCSTDATRDILSRHAEEDQRIRVIYNQKNSKLAYSLNHCLEYANGEYIARMDADDESIPERLEIQVSFLDAHPEYAVVGSYAYVNNGIEIAGIREGKEQPTWKDCLVDTPFIHPSIMMRRSVYTALGGYTVAEWTIRGQDAELWFRFFSDHYNGYNIQQPLLIYHESKTDLKKRSLSVAILALKRNIIGYRLLKVPFYMYILAFKPIISALIPHSLMIMYYKWRLKAR